jgi:hypothetical protein
MLVVVSQDKVLFLSRLKSKYVHGNYDFYALMQAVRIIAFLFRTLGRRCCALRKRCGEGEVR